MSNKKITRVIQEGADQMLLSILEYYAAKWGVSTLEAYERLRENKPQVIDGYLIRKKREEKRK